MYMIFVALILSLITYSLFTPSLGRAAYQRATRTLDAFLKQARKFGFLGLYKDQVLVFIICYLILLTADLWR